MTDENQIDRALRGVPADRLFIVAFANPDKPQVVLTLHPKDGTAGESFVTRTITLEADGLVIFDSRNSFKDVLAPRDPDGIAEQVRALVHAFADECGIADEDFYFGGKRAGRAATTDALELPAVWMDVALVRSAQASFRSTKKSTSL